jgi:hypothetical protein
MCLRVIQWLSLVAPYEEERSENKFLEQLLILVRRYLCVFFLSFNLAISW